MPLDPNIALSVRPVRLDNIQDVQMKGMQLRDLARRGQAADQDEAAQRTIRDLYRQNTKADGTVDSAAFIQGVAQAGLGDRIPGIQKQGAELAHANATTADSELTLHKKKLDILNGGLSSLLANPAVTHEDVIAQINNFVNQGLITPDEGAKAARDTPGRPEQLRPFLVQKALEASDASKRLEAILPKYDEQDTGGAINQGTINQLTGARTAGTDVAKTATPGEKLTADAKRATNERVSFSPDAANLMAALAERGVALPAGLRSREQMKATFEGLLARNPGSAPDEIAEKIATGQIDFGAEKKETTTAAGQAGKIAVAQNEVKGFVPLVRQQSALVPRGSFMPFNKLSQMADNQISDPELRKLKNYVNSLLNAYDSLAARGGTDMEKRKHNREMIASADSPEVLNAALDSFLAEADIAAKAASDAMKRHPQAAASGEPADIAAILKKHGGGK